MLATSVAQQQATLLQNARVVVVVQYLAVLREDGGERCACTVTQSHTIYHTCHLVLRATWAGVEHSCGVHLVANLESLLKGCNLLG